AMAPHQREKLERGLGALHCRPRRRRRAGLWKKLEHRRRDDAERAFGADEELLQIVTGVVLAQAPQAVPEPPVRQHDFETQYEIAGVAIAEHVDAARVGGKI